MDARRYGRTVVAAALFLAALSAPAAAQRPAAPEISDPCGIGAHTVDQQPLPWLDICAAWFEVAEVDDVPVLEVTLEVAGELASRTPGTYRVGWSSGGCGFEVRRTDEGGGDLLEVDRAPSVELLAHCDPGRLETCDPPVLEDLGFVCGTPPEPTRFDVSAGYAEDGRELSWSVPLDGELEVYADLHRSGAVLTATNALTGANARGVSFFPGYCERVGSEDWRCRNQVGDRVLEGRDHVVGG